MTFVVKDRVKDTTTTTGTGTITLAGAPPAGFQAFSAIGDGNTCPYTIVDGATGAWETGIGTYASAGPALARTTVLRSSNADVAVNFAAGTKDVFVSLPAGMVGWQQIGATQTPSGVASSSITSIPDRFSDLKVEFLGLSHDSGSNQTLRIELSSDNGGSWTTAVNLFGGAQAAAATMYGAVTMVGYRHVSGVILGQMSSITADNTVGAAGGGGLGWRLSAGINGIRLSYTGGNIDAGSWKLWGRP